LMRGVPRLAVKRNLPVFGAQYRAQDIADTSSICPWNPDMYGVDMRKPGAQAYYDSVFRLFASWGVDFVKMDDMSRPYDAHAPEIEAANRAIQANGRPITLSLSPGETPVPRAGHVRRHAQMWRISDDFWDEWPLLEAQFVRLENWNPHRRPGGWPDADMLPLGRLALGERDTKFTPEEQRTVMTLWSIARSPLIMGGDLRRLDAATLALLTNREVIAVNQASTDNQPLFVEDGMRVWTARPEGSTDRYLALFNLRGEAREVGIDLRWLGISTPVRVRDLWTGRDLGVRNNRVSQHLGAHGAGLYRLT
jgi:alpha-galactosidase